MKLLKRSCWCGGNLYGPECRGARCLTRFRKSLKTDLIRERRLLSRRDVLAGLLSPEPDGCCSLKGQGIQRDFLGEDCDGRSAAGAGADLSQAGSGAACGG